MRFFLSLAHLRTRLLCRPAICPAICTRWARIYVLRALLPSPVRCAVREPEPERESNPESVRGSVDCLPRSPILSSPTHNGSTRSGVHTDTETTFIDLSSLLRARNQRGWTIQRHCKVGQEVPEPGVLTSILPTSLCVARGSRCTDVPSMTVSTHGLLVIATPPARANPTETPRRISLSRAHSSTALRQISHQVKFSQHGSDATRQRNRGIYKRGQMQLATEWY